MTGPATRVWKGMTIPTAGTYQLDQAHKRVGFVGRHMMVSPVRGEFTEARASIVVDEDPLRSSVRASIRSASIVTGHDERDVHLKSPDFLDVERFPTLEYRSTGMVPQDETDPIFFWARLRGNNRLLGRRGGGGVEPPPVRASGRFVLTGELTIKDVTRPVDLQVEFGGTRTDLSGQEIFGFTATAEFDREDYGLLWNVALEGGGVLVGKSVRIEIAAEAIRQS
ncbi:YceI family protein [Micromonospora sp. 15K316]|uniref:YceI family protein n=1 Tax=Micromonospora sp. 15K316 TaxID=2530376 RepID=UPI00104D50B8|nr:YceI family protein [Micromonospora sp. 15K316]TDC39264.1 YceI family protein [Micromonospora sp. 15K316]